jgi:hypothetical protein
LEIFFQWRRLIELNMDDVIWLDDLPVEPPSPDDVPAGWTVGRFQKQHGCQHPG